MNTEILSARRFFSTRSMTDFKNLLIMVALFLTWIVSMVLVEVILVYPDAPPSFIA